MMSETDAFVTGLMATGFSLTTGALGLHSHYLALEHARENRSGD